MTNIIEEQESGLVEQRQSLADNVEAAIGKYFAQLGDQSVSNIYEMFLAEVEEPLFNATMRHTRNNQSKAARLMGISRGTLRKKLKIYDLL